MIEVQDPRPPVVGEYTGQITEAEIEEKEWENKDGSTTMTYSLAVTIQLEDPVTHEAIMKTTPFIKPILTTQPFQQLVDLCGEDMEKGQSFNEQALLGKNVIVNYRLNAKGYSEIEAIKLDESPTPEEAPATAKKKAEKVDDLPFK